MVQTTEAAADSLARIIDLATGFPLRGTPPAAGAYRPIPATWDGRGNPPHGWTLTNVPIWRNGGGSAWIELTDAVAATCAASPLLTAGQKAEVAAAAATRVTVTDPKEGLARKPRCTASQKTVMCVGDSWTKGTTNTTPVFHTWRNILQSSAAVEPGFPRLNFVGPQVDGDTSDPESDGINASRMGAHNGSQLATNCLFHSPDVVVMCLGINDAGDGPIDQELFKQFWRDVSTLRPAATRIWVMPPNVWGATGIGPNIDSFRAAIPASVASLSGEGIAVTVHDWAGALTVPDDMEPGGNHPNTLGYEKLGAHLWPTFKAALGF